MVKYPYQFEVTDKLLEFFEQERIYLSHVRKIRGVYKVGSILTIRSPAQAERHATFPYGSFFSLGAHSYSRSPLEARTSVGRYCSIARGCVTLGIEHPTDWVTTHIFAFRRYYRDSIIEEYSRAPEVPRFNADLGPVIIENDVWIAQDVRIRPGVRIGNGAIVASGSLVLRDVLPYEIVGGVPARHIRFRLPSEIIERMMNLRWWEYNIPDFHELPVDRPEEFLNGLEARINCGEIHKWSPGLVNLAEAIDTL